MKKFEELERFEKELAATQAVSSVQQPTSPGDPVGGGESGSALALTDSQLEELFKRTSNFTVKALNEEGLAEMELWQLHEGSLNGAGTSAVDDEGEEELRTFGPAVFPSSKYLIGFSKNSDYLFLDDDDWEAEVEEETERKSRSRQQGAVSGDSSSSKIGDKKQRNKAQDREAVINRYKAMQIHMSTNYAIPMSVLMAKSKNALVDPLLPTYVRLPPCPISRTWARRIAPLREACPPDQGR